MNANREGPEFIIIYDTYCGWCYAAAPIFDALVHSGANVKAFHRHLFQGSLAYRMSAGKGSQVLRADAQISALTGQRFSQTYIDNVVLSDSEILESGYSAQAAALVHSISVQKEFALRARLQKLRYIEGVSTSDRNAVVNALVDEGVAPEDAKRIGTPGLIASAENLARRAAQWLERVGATGVPVILKLRHDEIEVIDHVAYYQNPELIRELVPVALDRVG